MQYEDFEVEICRCLCGEEEVRVLQSPVHRPCAPFKSPYGPRQFQSLMVRLDRLRQEQGATGPEARRALAKEVGERLYHSLFPGPLALALENSLASLGTAADGSKEGLRIRIGFGNLQSQGDLEPRFRPEVLGAPWELLLRPGNQDFLSLGAHTQVVRYLDAPIRVRPLQATPPIKILAVFSSPKAPQISAIDVALQKSQLRRAVGQQPRLQIRILPRPTLAELRRHLLQEPFHILHFLGHGGFRQSTGEGVLLFEKEDRSPQQVSGQELAEYLQVANSLRMVVLNSCSQAMMVRRKGQDAFSGTAAALLWAGVPAVVAMQFKISKSAAFAFSSTFYQSLAEAQPVDAAVAAGRQAIRESVHEDGSLEWATPVLFLRGKESRILDLKESGVPEPVRIGILSIIDWGQEMQQKTDYLLDVSPFFDGRRIHSPSLWWDEILPDLELFLAESVSSRYPNRLDMAALLSIAFATGWLLEAKSRRELEILQNGKPWREDDDPALAAQGWGEGLELHSFAKGKQDLAVAVSLSRPIEKDVVSFLAAQVDAKSDKEEGQLESASLATVGAVLAATAPEHVGKLSVRNGAHALRLAEELVHRMAEWQTDHPFATFHLFISAPNAFTFFFGHVARSLRRVQLYEHSFGEGGPVYEPSFRLPKVLPRDDGL